MECVKSYFRCMLRALRDIHARGIIHRDVKPANFLFDPRRGIGTLCDFGLASVRECLWHLFNSWSSDRSLHSAWMALPRSSAHAFTPRRRQSIPTGDFGQQLLRSSISRKCRRRRGSGAGGTVTAWVLWRRTHGISSSRLCPRRQF
jgi:serine/threonine protein kinase